MARKDSLREVRLDTGQLIGHVAEASSEHAQTELVTTCSGDSSTTQQRGSDVVAGSGDDPTASTSGAGSNKNTPFKIVHLNPEQLRELNIALPSMEPSDGPLQVYIIDDSAAANATPPSAQTQTLIRQDVTSGPTLTAHAVSVPDQGEISQETVSSSTTVTEEGVVVSEHAHFVAGVPFQKSEESGFYSMELDEGGSQLGGVGVNPTENDTVVDSSTNQEAAATRSQSEVRVSEETNAAHELVHSQPERDSVEDGVPPTKRRRMDSSE